MWYKGKEEIPRGLVSGQGDLGEAQLSAAVLQSPFWNVPRDPSPCPPLEPSEIPSSQ